MTAATYTCRRFEEVPTGNLKGKKGKKEKGNLEQLIYDPLKAKRIRRRVYQKSINFVRSNTNLFPTVSNEKLRGKGARQHFQGKKARILGKLEERKLTVW